MLVMKRLALFFSLLWTATLPASSQPSKWPTYAPAKGISVRLPAPPETSQRVDGSVTAQLYTSKMPWGTYTVTYVELPAAVAVLASSDKIYGEARDRLLYEAQAVGKTFDDASPRGKKLFYENHEIQGWANFVLMGRRLYVADVKLKRGQSKEKYVEPFLSSVEISRAR
jgi:hypothetical protein